MDVRHVEVEIEELVLRGFDGIDGAVLAASLQSALGARLLAEADLGRSRAVDLVQARAVEVAPGATARTLGRAVAERVHGSIRQ